MKANIPEVKEKRVVVVGGGFAGLTLMRQLVKKKFQIVLIDKNNYHQFQPLFYQVATAGLEPSAISFPFRKVFQSKKNIHIRVTEVVRIDTQLKRIYTTIGYINYDYLVVAIGADTNFFGNEFIQTHSFPMKSVSEALGLRNNILQNFEKALITEDQDEKDGYMNFVVVGGGPTGVELTGALAEMKRFVLPKDYPELDFNRMKIYLLEASGSLLKGMSYVSSEKAYQYLLKLGVKVMLNTQVKDYDGKHVIFEKGNTLRSNTMIWAAGVHANRIEGLDIALYGRGNRLMVDQVNRVKGYDTVFAIGDVSLMASKKFPNGHPQLAQVAMQQARLLAKNLENEILKKPLKPFVYKDLGSMATVGRNLAVVDLPFVSFQGFFAWMVWMFVHLFSIVGVKNRLLIFINWLWNYFTYDQSLRLIIKSADKHKVTEKDAVCR
jgi:NADH:ubiquinone reductase (H+-translocating)